MATYKSSVDSRGYNLELDVTQGTQSIPNNTSIINYALYLKTGSMAWSHSDMDWSINIGGQVKSGRWTPTTATAFNSRIAIPNASGTVTITHNADGTKSISVSASWTIQRPSSYSPLNASTSGTLALTTIPRASQPRLNVSTQNLGSAITIYTDRASSSFTHTLTYSFGTQSGTIATGVATSQAWTLPIGLASAIPNSLSGVGTITCTTYNGSTSIGSKSVSFTATVPNNATFQPTATINSIVEGDTLPSGITVFVQNQSKAKVTSSGTGKYNSTIKTYSVTGIGTYTGSVITSDTLRNSGTVRVTLTVTDSRGLKGSTFQDINVVAYSPPQLPTFNAIRSESTPENILASFNASISPISDQNNKLFRIRSKASDGGWVVETSATEMYTFSGTQTIVSDPDKSYTIEFFIQDSFTSITQTVQVGTAFTLIDFNTSGKGMAIGKVSESDTFEVALPSEFISPATIDTYPIWHSGNSNVMEDSGSNANGRYIRFSDGTQICWHTVSFQATFTAWGNLYSFDYTTKITYPSAFISNPSLNVTSTYNVAMITIAKSDATGITQVSLARPNINNTTYSIDYVAIGRWK